MNLGVLMAAAIGKMRLAGLADYGRFPKGEDQLVEMSRVWAAVAKDRGVRPETVLAAAERHCAAGGDFPSAGEFASTCDQIRFETYVSIGVELSDGRLLPVEVPAALPPAERRARALKEVGRLGLQPLPEPLPRLPSPRAQALLDQMGMQPEAKA